MQSLDSAKLISFAAFTENEKPKSGGKGKKGGKKKNAQELVPGSATKRPSHYYILSMTDSVFFPEGGGQPSDRGTILLRPTLDSSNSVEVTTAGSNDEDEQSSASSDEIKLHVNDVQNHNGICLVYCYSDSSSEGGHPLMKHMDMDCTYLEELRVQ